MDRLTKYCHLGALPTGFNATLVAEFFVQQIVKLHGYPASIVSDRDRVFTSVGRIECKIIAYHPQSDGQTEVVNRCIEMYLRSIVHDNPKRWLHMVPWAELWYNSSHQSAIGMSPFKALYGREAPLLPHYIQGSSTLEAVDRDLENREQI